MATNGPRVWGSTGVAVLASCVGLGTAAQLVPEALAMPARASRTTRTPACLTSGLVITVDSQGGAAAGTYYARLDFTNLAGHTCTLFGYPGVSAVDLRGRQLGSPATRNATHAARSVALKNGASATAVLQIVNAQNYPASRCRRVPAAGLRVYPPGQRSSKIVPYVFQACARPGAGVLAVQPVQKR